MVFEVLLATAGPQETRRGFIDRERDPESQLRSFGVRQYDQATGRFLSIDPLWAMMPFDDPYSYVGNNPMSLVDPSGFEGDDPEEPPPPPPVDPNDLPPPVVVTAHYEGPGVLESLWSSFESNVIEPVGNTGGAILLGISAAVAQDFSGTGRTTREG